MPPSRASRVELAVAVSTDQESARRCAVLLAAASALFCAPDSFGRIPLDDDEELCTGVCKDPVRMASLATDVSGAASAADGALFEGDDKMEAGWVVDAISRELADVIGSTSKESPAGASLSLVTLSPLQTFN